MSKRDAIRRVLSVSGIANLRWRSLRPGLYCFNYHRIGDALSCPFDRRVYSCTAARFREHVELLRDRFEVIDLARLQAIDRQPARGKPLALITFDDGYIDNYSIAFPILQDLGVTAAFFIPTAYIGGSRLPWWDEIAWSLRNAGVDRLRLKGAEVDYDLGPTEVERSIGLVLSLVKRRREIPMEEQVAEIREQCQPTGSLKDAGARLFIDEDGLREMRRAGMDIGSHTHTHPILSHLDGPAQKGELEASKEILEGILNEEVSSIAYPVGSASAYTPETCRISAAAGYTLGFNFVHVANRLPLEKPFEVTRFAVDDNQSVSALKSTVCFEWL